VEKYIQRIFHRQGIVSESWTCHQVVALARCRWHKPALQCTGAHLHLLAAQLGLELALVRHHHLPLAQELALVQQQAL
jgi:hypothetical protein